MPQFSERALSTIQNAIPPARFQTYLHAGGSLDKAVALYLWNMKAASAVTQVPGLVEVLLRNTIDLALQSWNIDQSSSPEWITRPAPPLQHLVRPSPPKSWKPSPTQPLWNSWWEARAECSEPNPSHHDLVAGLSFGTWTSILPSPHATSKKNDRLKLWTDALEAKFGGQRREAIYRWSHEIRVMRNRASHLRPLLDIQRLKTFHKFSIRLLRSMDEDFGQIVAGLAIIPQVIGEKP